MIIKDKNLIKSAEKGSFPTVDALCATLPRDVRLHMKRVGKYADILYHHMLETEPEDMAELADEAFVRSSEEIFTLHDIGRHYIPVEILNKVEGLEEAEKQIIREHTVNARRALLSIYIQPFSDTVMKRLEEIAVYHHERYDGKGYPEGLKGGEIPLLAGICAIADTYDGIVSWKPYKRRQTTKEEAVRIIESEAGGQFQPELVEIFKQCVRSF